MKKEKKMKLKLKLKKVLSAVCCVLTVSACVAAMTLTAGAEETVTGEAYGLKTSVATEKSEYSADEEIKVEFSVANTNDFDVENVTISAVIPNEFEVKDNAPDSKVTDVLEQGKSESLSVVLVSNVSESPDGNQGDNGDSDLSEGSTASVTTGIVKNIAVPVGIAAVAFAAVIFGKKKLSKNLSLFLCLTVFTASIVSVGIPSASATETGSFTVNKTVKSGGKDYTVGVTVTYDMTDTDESSDSDTESDAGEEGDYSVFETLPEGFIFSSGIGGWETYVFIEKDGTFTGSYSSSNAIESFSCNFSGEFTAPVKVNDYTYKMKLKSIETETTEVKDRDGVRYEDIEPYGFDNADEFLIYMPGTPVSELSEDFLWWLHNLKSDDEYFPENIYALYNVGGDEVFEGVKYDESDSDTTVPDTDTSANNDTEKSTEPSILQSVPKQYSTTPPRSTASGDKEGVILNINDDGTFEGQFFNHYFTRHFYGDNPVTQSVTEINVCNFKGVFSSPTKIDDYTYKMNIESMEVVSSTGEYYYDDGLKVVYCDSNSFFHVGDEIQIYLPGKPISDLGQGFWEDTHMSYNPDMVELNFYGLYNASNSYAFSGGFDGEPLEYHYPQLKEKYKYWGRHFVVPFLYSLKYRFTQKMLKL